MAKPTAKPTDHSSANNAMISTERNQRISQLELEIENRRDEIHQLQGLDAVAASPSEKSNDDPLQKQSLGELIVLWEQRLSENRTIEPAVAMSTKEDSPCTPRTVASSDADSVPSMVWETDDDDEASTTSCSNATPNSPPSPCPPRALFEQQSHHQFDQQVSIQMVEERDLKIKSLEATILEDRKIMMEMKDTIKKLMREKENEKPTVASDKNNSEWNETLPANRTVCGADPPTKGTKNNQPIIIGPVDCISHMAMSQLQSTVSLHEKQNKTLREECTKLQTMVSNLDSQSSSQENTIEFLKAKLVEVLVSKEVVENQLNTEIEYRNASLSNLEKSFNETNQTISALEASNSSLEDQVERLKAENLRLRVQSQMLEEEISQMNKRMENEIQSVYVETGRYEIL
eukprot:CAMPEP_0183717590 /NCGR_PEP_ID=MMETSP0737-20130205/11171_1 /TAXON_ID=385413 /ORGANISM="Thalassiosira miniscula, Strain CCMP1093" /LENGTH=402 /DNA_ID=CAMNT_0025947063 /DNA_START=186 /DNA_END=1394 /DNA_ORIENTATION=-